MMLGDLIKQKRKELKISQRELAKRLNIPYSTLANYENNHREPKNEQLIKIANALCVPVQDLLIDKDNISNLFGEMFDNNSMAKQNLDILSNSNNETLNEFKDVVTSLILSISNLSTDHPEHDDLYDSIKCISQILDKLDVFLTFYYLNKSHEALKEIESFTEFKRSGLEHQLKEGE